MFSFSFPCSCEQKHHTAPVKAVEVSEHAVEKVPEILKEYHRIFLVADENTYAVGWQTGGRVASKSRDVVP